MRIVSINLLFIFIAFLAFELSMGRWLGFNSFRDLSIPVSQPFSLDTSDIYPGGKIIQYKTDQNGFRGTHENTEDIFVLAIGGSTTREVMVGDGETWTDIFSRELSKAVGGNVGVANAGLDAQSTFGHIKAFDVWFNRIDDLKPKFVIAFIGINDQALGAPLAGFDDFQPSTLYQRIRNFVWNNSALYELYRRARGLYRAYAERVVHASRSRVESGDLYPNSPIKTYRGQLTPNKSQIDSVLHHLKAYGARIRILIERIRSIGAIPIIVNQIRGEFSEIGGIAKFKKIEGYSIDDMTKSYVYSKIFAKKAIRECRLQNAICIDLASELVILPNERYDLVHTTPEGSRRIGEYLGQKLLPLIVKQIGE